MLQLVQQFHRLDVSRRIKSRHMSNIFLGMWFIQFQITEVTFEVTHADIFYTARKGSPSSFLMPRISAKFQRGHPRRGHQIQVG